MRWVRLWNKHGLSGVIRAHILPRYSPSFKMEVITWLVKHKASYPETADHFNISNAGTIWQWKQTYNLHGIDGFTDLRKVINMSKKDAKKTPEQENEELKKRLEYPKAENTYLKKLKAVMDRTDKERKRKIHYG